MGNESGRSGAVSLDEWRDPDAVDYQCCDEHSEIGCEGGHHQNERERHIAHRAKLGLRKKPVKSTSLNFACFVLRGVGKGDRPSGILARQKSPLGRFGWQDFASVRRHAHWDLLVFAGNRRFPGGRSDLAGLAATVLNEGVMTCVEVIGTSGLVGVR